MQTVFPCFIYLFVCFLGFFCLFLNYPLCLCLTIWLDKPLGKTAQFSILFKTFPQMELVGKIHNLKYPLKANISHVTVLLHLPLSELVIQSLRFCCVSHWDLVLPLDFPLCPNKNTKYHPAVQQDKRQIQCILDSQFV